MRVIFMGTPDFALETMYALEDAGHKIVLAVTQPDRPSGRGGKIIPSPVRTAARGRGIKVYTPVKIRDAECIKYLDSFRPDIIVVAAYGQILPRGILEMPHLGCINVHASLLPKYRGAAPIQWALINGEKKTGITIMRMDEGLDTGDIILSEEIKIGEKETAGSLFERLANLGGSLCARALREIEEGRAVYTRQDNSKATYTSLIKKSFGLIDWNRPAAEIERMIRALDPWPGTYTELDGKILKIWEADVLCGDTERMRKSNVWETENVSLKKADIPVCGTVSELRTDGILTRCGSGELIIRCLQPEGKKRMSAKAFLAGHPIKEGTRFGR